jgi:hypothetical protein
MKTVSRGVAPGLFEEPSLSGDSVPYTPRPVGRIDSSKTDAVQKLEQSYIETLKQMGFKVDIVENVTPADILYGRREEIIQRRKEVQILTINRRRNYNQGLRELVNAA